MNSNYKLSGLLLNRQINLDNLNSNFHKEKIFESFYSTSKIMHHLRRNIDLENYNRTIKSFCFSENGNYLAADYFIFQLNEDFFLNDSTKIMTINNKFNRIEALSFNKDATKLFAYELNRITINDVFNAETECIINTDLFVNNISNDNFNNNLFVFGCNDGGLYIHDLRCLMTDKIFQSKAEIRSSQYHPTSENLLLITSPCEDGLFTFDIRNHKPVFNYKILYNNEENNLCAKYNRKGDQIFFTRLESNPVLFKTNNSYPIAEFDDYGPNDEYVIAASEDTNVFMWHVPKEALSNNEQVPFKINSAKHVLKHCSEVYSVGYNYHRSILACSGKLESLKFWSPIGFTKNYESEVVDNPIIDYDLNYDIILCTKDRLKEFIYCSIDKKTEACLNKEYFTNISQTFKDANSDKILENFNKDPNINYIKKFIENFINKQEKRKNLFNESKNACKENSAKIFFVNNHLSIIFEIFKVLVAENFMQKSVSYLNDQLNELENLKRKISYIIELKESIVWTKKIELLDQIKTSLKSLINDLEIILKENKSFNEQILNTMNILIYNFIKLKFDSNESRNLINNLLANLKIEDHCRSYN